jgi:hypothetical protein
MHAHETVRWVDVEWPRTIRNRVRKDTAGVNILFSELDLAYKFAALAYMQVGSTSYQVAVAQFRHMLI